MGVESLYSARWTGPSLIEKGSTQTISIDIERDNAAPTITSATFSLFSPDGDAVVDAATATIASGNISYEIGATVLDSYDYGQKWLIRIDATISSTVYSFYNDGAICKVRIFPPITHSDLTARHGDISSLLPAGTNSTQSYIDSAWIELTGRMYADAIPFWTLRTISALRAPLLYRALSFVFRDFSTMIDPGDKYFELADRYEKEFERSYSKLRGFFDPAQTNIIDGDRKPTASIILLSNRRRA